LRRNRRFFDAKVVFKVPGNCSITAETAAVAGENDKLGVVKADSDLSGNGISRVVGVVV